MSKELNDELKESLAHSVYLQAMSVKLIFFTNLKHVSSAHSQSSSNLYQYELTRSTRMEI
ncbi:hypothetical protein C0J52_04062 [Blattella germanica]|nr:hypothetical protein C0J52_04062 [Blattella germanica]